MKKLLCVTALAGMLSLGYCQDVKVNINNKDVKTTQDCPYRVNGICITEDIGGVDVVISGYPPVAKFTNYNSFPVTVAYELEYDYPSAPNNVRYTSDNKTGTIVIGVQGQKDIPLSDRSSSQYWSLKGIVVRKMGK